MSRVKHLGDTYLKDDIEYGRKGTKKAGRKNRKKVFKALRKKISKNIEP